MRCPRDSEFIALARRMSEQERRLNEKQVRANYALEFKQEAVRQVTVPDAFQRIDVFFLPDRLRGGASCRWF